jgi:hypothetical protein
VSYNFTSIELTNESNQTIPGSTIRYNGKGPRIEPIIADPKELEKLNKMLESNRFGPTAKRYRIGRTFGYCSMCQGIPTHLMIYDCDGVAKIERYCDSCLSIEIDRQKSNFYTQEY